MNGGTFSVYFRKLADHLVETGYYEDKTAAILLLGQLVRRKETTLYEWQNGRQIPSRKLCPALHKLVELGKQQGLDRGWAFGFLQAVGCPDLEDVLSRIYGPEIPHKVYASALPAPLDRIGDFIGRKQEVDKLFRMLSPDVGSNVITVDGPAGVGKTTIVLHVVNKCLDASLGHILDPTIPIFDAIIFVSAKDQRLTESGVVHLTTASRTFHSIFFEIAEVLNLPKLRLRRPAKQKTEARRALGSQRTLLIVDNFETITEPSEREKVISLFEEPPKKLKVVITTRDRAPYNFIHVRPLQRAEAIQFIMQEVHNQEGAEAEEAPITQGHREESAQNQSEDEGTHRADGIGIREARRIYTKVGGIPAAIRYVIGQVYAGRTLKDVLAGLGDPKGDVALFCFGDMMQQMKDTPAYYLLLAASVFAKAPQRVALARVADLNPAQFNTALDELRKRLLLTEVPDNKGHFTIEPLTREYALYELNANPDWEKGARERWVNWYLDFVKEWGGRDWERWYSRYAKLEQEWVNLEEVFEWCNENNKVHEMGRFWSDYGVGEFCSIREHWDSRLFWLRWLINAAEQYGGKEAVEISVSAKANRAWTLIFMGEEADLRDAEKLLLSAWEQREWVDAEVRFDVAHNLGVLSMRGRLQNGDFWKWYGEQRQALDAMSEPPRQKTRRYVEMEYWKASYLFQIGETEEAEKVFLSVKQMAEELGWERAENYIQNWLADIAISKEGEEDLAYAGKLITSGLAEAKRARDLRRTAQYTRSLAVMKKKLGEHTEACKTGAEALKAFRVRGMAKETEEVITLLQGWGCPVPPAEEEQ